MKIAMFAQCMYSPWIEWIKNNSLLLSKELSQKIDLEIISHKPKIIQEDKNIVWLKINYLLKLSDNKIFQLFYFIIWAINSLLFIYKKNIKIISFQYLETSFILPIIFISLFKWNTKFILTIYSTDEVSIWYKKIILKLFKFKFKKIVIISQYLRTFLLELWYKNENIIYIPLSYDKNRYLKLAPFEKKDKKTILFSAWIIKKSWSFFMVDLASIMPEYKFIFALRKFNKKSENELELLEKYIEEKWVRNIEIKRNIEKMEDLLWEVWALILPLQDINIKMLIPLALLEAMARWTICFVSDLPNLKLLVSNNKNAIIFKKDDLFDLKNKIDKSINNEQISIEAYNFWRSFSDYKEIWEKYFNLLKNI